MKSFRVLSVNISEETGVPKRPVDRVVVRENFGIEGDAHAGAWHRQVSLLAVEDIDTMRRKGLTLQYGDFAENITTQGIDLAALPVGTRLSIDGVLLEVSQIGKECQSGCAIRQQTGDCIMPTRGIFAKVIRGGAIGRESTGMYDI